MRECEALVDLIYDGEAPKRIGHAECTDRIKEFTDSLEDSVRTLRSLGVDISLSRSFHGKKCYLTLAITEQD